MRRTAARLAAAVAWTLAIAGCASILGIEEQTFDGVDGGAGRGGGDDAAGSDSGSSSGSSGGGSGADQSTTDAPQGEASSE